LNPFRQSQKKTNTRWVPK